MHPDSEVQRRPWRFFALTFALAVPFWILGAMVNASILPRLPIAALDFICPGLAAVILVHREQGRAAARAFLGRSVDFRRVTGKAWYLPALLLMPLIMLASLGVQRLSGSPVPVAGIAPGRALAYCAIFLAGAAGEELGWTGYATDCLQERWSVLASSLAVGCVWAVYHYVALAEAHRPVSWIAWWTLFTVAARVIIAWLHDNANRSVSIAALFHMTINVTWQLFPVNGSYYDPRTTGCITAAVAAVIVVCWRPVMLGKRSGQSVRTRRVAGGGPE